MKEVEGEYYADGVYKKTTFTPEASDIEYLRSFKHEDLTFRGTVEFRSVCCQPIRDAMTVAAFHVGLKTKLKELTAMLENDRVIYGHGYNPTELRHLFIKRKLPSFVDVDAVYRLARNITKLAYEGLAERGYGEEHFIEPLFDRIDHRANPASDMLRKLETGTDIEDVIIEYSTVSDVDNR